MPGPTINPGTSGPVPATLSRGSSGQTAGSLFWQVTMDTGSGNVLVGSSSVQRGWNVSDPGCDISGSSTTGTLIVTVPSNAAAGTYAALKVDTVRDFPMPNMCAYQSVNFQVVAGGTDCPGPGPCPCGA